MKLVRVLSAASLALLAAAPALAAVGGSKPGADSSGPVARPEPPAPASQRTIEQATARPDVSPPATDDAKPADNAVPADTAAPAESAEAPKPAAAERPSVFANFSLPAWIADSGLPLWAWAILGTFAFLMLRGLFRRRDRRDLTGPPSRTWPAVRPNPPAPRAADPIRRN